MAEVEEQVAEVEVPEEPIIVFHEKLSVELVPGAKISNVIAAAWLPAEVKVSAPESCCKL